LMSSSVVPSPLSSSSSFVQSPSSSMPLSIGLLDLQVEDVSFGGKDSRQSYETP
jgi:hypothetical protein